MYNNKICYLYMLAWILEMFNYIYREQSEELTLEHNYPWMCLLTCAAKVLFHNANDLQYDKHDNRVCSYSS